MVYGDDMGRRHLLDPSTFEILISEEEVTKDLTVRSKFDAFMGLTELKLKGQYELTILTNGCLPPTHRVYKEITCSSHLVKPKRIPIKKGSRKIRPKETPKRKRLLIQQGNINTQLL